MDETIIWTPFEAVEAVEISPESYTEEERIDAWQYLIDSGLAWSLQGCYGRMAKQLIEEGVCRPPQGG